MYEDDARRRQWVRSMVCICCPSVWALKHDSSDPVFHACAIKSAGQLTLVSVVYVNLNWNRGVVCSPAAEFVSYNPVLKVWQNSHERRNAARSYFFGIYFHFAVSSDTLPAGTTNCVVKVQTLSLRRSRALNIGLQNIKMTNMKMHSVSMRRSYFNTKCRKFVGVRELGRLNLVVTWPACRCLLCYPAWQLVCNQCAIVKLD